jgi:hypothetical protein
VEDFEQKMNVLAEAHRAAPGRWVLMPRKGHRFMGPDRQRARVKRRRRQVFMVLLEATGLTLIMGIFPPFRIMLWATAVLVFVLLAYMAALVSLRVEEVERARMRSTATGRDDGPGGYGYEYEYEPAGYARARYESPARASSYGNGNGGGYAFRNSSNGNGNGNGHGNGQGAPGGGAEWLETGVRVVDDDVHVVVYRSDEIDTSSLTSASG